MIVVIGPEKRLARPLTQAHQRRLRMTGDRIARARQKEGLHARQAVEAAEQVVGRDLGAADGKGRMAV